MRNSSRILFAVVLLVHAFSGVGFADVGARHANVFLDLTLDISHFASDPDMYRAIGLVALAPAALGPMLDREEPEITEMWAQEDAGEFFRNGDKLGEAYVPVSISLLCLTLGRLDRSGNLESF